MSKLTPEETVREHNRGEKAAGEGRSRYWSEPWAYPFEPDEHYEERRQAFEQEVGRQILAVFLRNKIRAGGTTSTQSFHRSERC